MVPRLQATVKEETQTVLEVGSRSWTLYHYDTLRETHYIKFMFVLKLRANYVRAMVSIIQFGIFDFSSET
jgi:hypothetical protein